MSPLSGYQLFKNTRGKHLFQRLSQCAEDVYADEDDGGADESLSAVALPEQCYAEEGAEYDAHLPQGEDVADRG